MPENNGQQETVGSRGCEVVSKGAEGNDACSERFRRWEVQGFLRSFCERSAIVLKRTGRKSARGVLNGLPREGWV